MKRFLVSLSVDTWRKIFFVVVFGALTLWALFQVHIVAAAFIGAMGFVYWQYEKPTVRAIYMVMFVIAIIAAVFFVSWRFPHASWAK